MTLVRTLLFTVLLTHLASAAEKFDVVVYGGTAGGVMAAVEAARAGVSVALVEPGRFLGGLTSCGVAPPAEARPDTDPPEFYRRAGERYGSGPVWRFEPHVAAAVLREMIEEAGVTVFREQRLREEGGVRKSKRRVRRLIAASGVVFEAAVFIDASYEADLMAAAGATYRAGSAETAEPPAYSFPVCLTSNEGNQTPFPKPLSYDPARYAGIVDYLGTLGNDLEREPALADLLLTRPLPNDKTLARTRDHLPLLYSGTTLEYLESGAAGRVAIWQEHLDYTAGLFYFLATDPRVPESLRGELRDLGLCADEFLYSNQWAHQLHIRERRRLAGDVVLTWQDVGRDQERPVATALFRGEKLQVPFGVLVPKGSKIENLLVPLNPSAGDWVSMVLRDERVAMELGRAAGRVAAKAVQSNRAVRDAF